jgi:hypothetical protein
LNYKKKSAEKVKLGGSQSKVGQGKSVRPYLKNELKAKELGYGLSGRAFAY